MFADKLKASLANFEIVKVNNLLDEIHKFEENGGELSVYEEHLWSQLTEACEAYPKE